VGDTLARVLSLQRFETSVARDIEQAFILGTNRTENQDIEFSMIPLVSVAVRALSPGVNDPFTAVMCIDRIAEALAKLLWRGTPSRYRFDETDQLRVILHPRPFEELFHTALDQIRHYGRNDLKIVTHLLTTIGWLSSHAREPSDIQLLQQYLTTTYRDGRLQFTSPLDLEQIDQTYTAAAQELREQFSVESSSS
jgi:uncharacterized membrane protein